MERAHSATDSDEHVMGVTLVPEAGRVVAIDGWKSHSYEQHGEALQTPRRAKRHMLWQGAVSDLSEGAPRRNRTTVSCAPRKKIARFGFAMKHIVGSCTW